ncbi:hypothetical protein HK098_005649 [Nowakowskiella sp. JEL0407]|nr:hypothetical protein HK098_005649 [Nowakowskiella sp. JEL0407]
MESDISESVSERDKITAVENPENSHPNPENAAEAAPNYLDVVSEFMEKNSKLTPKKKTKARKYWDILKSNVQKGFFHSIMNQRVPIKNDFLTFVDDLWTNIIKNSSLSPQHDTTTQFVMAGWAAIKAAKHAERQKTSKPPPSQGNSTDQPANDPAKTPKDSPTKPNSKPASRPDSNEKSQDFAELDEEQKEKVFRPKSSGPINPLGEDEKYSNIKNNRIGGLGLDGMSLDSIPDINFARVCKNIAHGLTTQTIEDVDYFTVQVHFNRGWKILLLALTQSEPFARYIAMVALNKTIPVINSTLLDSTTHENVIQVLVNLMISDERSENRLKAVFLLGQLGFYLGTVREHAHLVKKSFYFLARKYLDIQYQERKLNSTALETFSSENRPLKIYLIHALGKFMCMNDKMMENLLIYMIYDEFLFGEAKFKQASKLKTGKRASLSPQKKNESGDDGSLFVIQALLGVFNNDLKRNEANQKYVGAIFKTFVQSLMRSPNTKMQMLAVQFISNWMPITNEDALSLGVENLLMGLDETKSLNIESFDKEIFKQQRQELLKKQYLEKARLTIRGKLLRQLLEIPGTSTTLQPHPDRPGYFFDCNSTLFFTRGIVIKLPIHPASTITINRPLPAIPGVPAGVTTAPPVFMDSSWAEKQRPPRSRYEYLEKTKPMPGLPFGYTYAPTAMYEISAHDDPSPTSSVETEPVSDTIVKAASSDRRNSRRMSSTRNSTVYRRSGALISNIRKGNLLPGSQEIEQSRKISDLKAKKNILPPGTTRQPLKSDMVPPESRKIPPGFLVSSPFPGYDPNQIDRYALPASAIYGRGSSPQTPLISKGSPLAKDAKTALIRPMTGLSKTDMLDGYTLSKHPILWPSKIHISQLGKNSIQRVLTKVTSVDKELASVTVKRESNDEQLLSVGATFCMFFRSRQNPYEWVSINLEVIDDEYDDDEYYSYNKPRSGSISGRATDTSRRVGSPITQSSLTPFPSGYTATAEPYFAPPLSLPPIPVGYTQDGIPYFGRNPSVKPIPAGMTIHGVRFFTNESQYLEGARNVIAGYDNNGHPFFIPRGCTLPSPAGYTSDGIPYYDIPSLMHQRGVMVIPAQIAKMSWPTFENEEEDLIDTTSILDLDESMQKPGTSRKIINYRNGRLLPIDEKSLISELINSLESSAPPQDETVEQIPKPTITQPVGKILRVSDFEKLSIGVGNIQTGDSTSNDDILKDPEDVVAFFRESDDLAHLKPCNMRVNIEPASVEFQSVQASVTKSILVRYRAGRGDHEERDFFVSVEPVEVFVLNSFHLKLQGEGMMELSVTFNPSYMKSEKVDGSITLIDDSAFSRLFALRRSFVRVSPSNIDAGWMLPDKRKEVQLKVENVSAAPIQLTMSLQNDKTIERPASGSKPTTGVRPIFQLPYCQIKLQPLESRNLPILFEPSSLGRFTDTLEISAPGGEVIFVGLVGSSGIPLALYVEDEENSQAGAAALTRERCEFMKKFKRNETNHSKKVGLTEEDMKILKCIMFATSDQESRRQTHTIDFGICSESTVSKTRCLSIMNLSDYPITVGLYSHQSFIKCSYLVRIAPHMANSVEIKLELATEESGNLKLRGDIRTAIEVICPEFQNIPLHIRAFIGQPLFFPMSQFSFFRPVRIGIFDTMESLIINESQYDLSACLKINEFGSLPEQCRSKITAVAGDLDGSVTDIRRHCILPVQFLFTATERGPLMSMVQIEIVKPFNIVIPAASSNKTLYLIGVCMEPYPRNANDLHDKNGIDFLRMWMSHPKRIIDEYPTPEERMQRFDVRGQVQQKRASIYGGADSHVTFFKDSVTFRSAVKARTPVGQSNDVSVARSQLQQIMVQHRGTKPQTVTFFGSTGFSIDPRNKQFVPGDAENVDIMFMPPQDMTEMVTTNGFGIALLDNDHYYHAIQITAKSASDFMIFPPPNKDGVVVLDFGRTEFSAKELEINTRNLLLCNAYSTSYSWDLKFQTMKGKFSPFSADMVFGELHSFDSYPLTFKFETDITGYFECNVELSVKETSDRLIKPMRIATVVLRGQAVTTSLIGFPDSIDFGSTVVYSVKRKVFAVTNNGNTETTVTALVRPPFTVFPKSFKLQPKGVNELQITYSPTESKVSQAKLQIFANQKLYMVLLNGVGGTAELICEKYDGKDVDFGLQREGTVSWISIYLTNKGTLPLAIRSITAEYPDLIKFEYVGTTSMVPYEGASSRSKNSVRKDYWSILKRKIRVFAALKDLVKKQTGTKKLEKSKNSNTANEVAIPLRVKKGSNATSNDQSLLNVIPQLRPFYSFHIRLGYLNKYQLKKDTRVFFHYMPITTDDDAAVVPGLIKCMSMRIIGSVFRPLEIFPPVHDFGLAPAERFMPQLTQTFDEQRVKNTYGVVREGKNNEDTSLQMQVVNMSMEAQNLSLTSITPAFTITGRTWQLPPGEKIFVPIEFHPRYEQVQYQGVASFIHKYGNISIRLGGTGASADVKSDEVVNFGSLKVQTVGSRLFRLSNKGLLDAKYSIEIIQPAQDFKFHSDEPYECEGIIESGGVQTVNIECCCQSVQKKAAHLLLRWMRVPRGIWEENIIPLKVEVGMPVFRLKNLELDFKTSYIGVGKRLVISATNDGNAACTWDTTPHSNFLSVEPSSGTLNPGDITFIEVRYSPETFEPLNAAINFRTDAGNYLLMCYGIVGIPYLRIPEEMRNISFGIIEINRTHTRSLLVTNSGNKVIEFEITMSNLKSNGVGMPLDDFDVFFVDPTRGKILPGETINLVVSCFPQEYNSAFSADFLISTVSGEEYSGSVSATGGKAIIKIAPPTLHHATPDQKPITAAMSESKPQSRENDENSEHLQSEIMESSKLLFNSHMEQLGDILAGLRAAEIDSEEDFTRLTTLNTLERVSDGMAEIFGSPSRPSSSKSQSRPITGSTRSGSARVKSKAEAGTKFDESFRKLISTRAVFDGSDVKMITANKLTDGDVQEGTDMTLGRKSKRAARLKMLRDKSFFSNEPQIFDSEDMLLGERAPADNSVAVKYMDELAALESEIMMKMVAGRTSKTTKLEPEPPTTLPTNTQNGGMGKYNPGVSTGRRLKGAKESNKLTGMQDSTQNIEKSAVSEGTHPRILEAEVLLDKGDIQEALSVCVPLLHEGRVEEIQQLIDDELFDDAADLLRCSLGLNHPPQFRSLLLAIKKLDTRDALSRAETEQLQKILATAKSNEANNLFNDGRTTALKELLASKHVGDVEHAILHADNSDIRQIVLFSRGTSIKKTPEIDNQPSNAIQAIMSIISQDAHIVEELHGKDKQTIQEVGERVLDQTRNVIKAVKEQLSTKWLTNREFLTAALRKLQQTTRAMEQSTNSGKIKKKENDFNLGLLRGGELSQPILLFNLPNEGNLDFHFEIVQDFGQVICPPEFNITEYASSSMLFVLDPKSGSISPGQSVNIAATFSANISGDYQQAYNLKSGEDVFLKFTVTAKVGIPILSISPKILDFGLVNRNRNASRTMMLSNVGTYRDTWRLETISAEFDMEGKAEALGSPSQTPFTITPNRGEIVPGEDQPITITFCPTVEGNFFSKCRILWSKEPMLVELKGAGGGVKIKSGFQTQEDVTFGGLEWGTCVIGVTYEKHLQITNTGNVEGVIEISHPNPCFRFQLRRDNNGFTRIAPGVTLDVIVTFSPILTETIKEAIVIKLPDGIEQIIPLHAFAGVCDWEIEGLLDFLNMPIYEKQLRQVKVLNTGDIAFPLEAEIQPIELNPFLELSLMSKGPKVAPREATTIQVNAQPTARLFIKGKLILTTNLGKGVIHKEIPFEFHAYDQQIALDNDQDANVGRIMIGEIARVQRSLINFGNTIIKYHVRIEAQHEANSEDPKDAENSKRKMKKLKPKKDKKGDSDSTSSSKATLNPWKLGSDSEGVISPSTSAKIEAIFESVDEGGDVWHEAKLIVEYFDNEHNKWTFLSAIKLCGSGGKPILVLYPSELQFSHVGVNAEKSLDVVLKNEGTALLNFTLESQWEHQEVFKLAAESFDFAGIEPGGELKLTIMFCPKETFHYNTKITFVTPLEPKILQLNGLGATYKVLESALPPILQIGEVVVGGVAEKLVSLFNDCIHDIQVNLIASKTENTDEIVENIIINPKKIDIPKNAGLNLPQEQRGTASFSVAVKASVPMTKDELPDFESIANMVQRGSEKFYLTLKVEGGAEHQIVGTYRYKVDDLVAVYPHTYDRFKIEEDFQVFDSDKLQFLNFGQSKMSAGSIQTMYIYNPNRVKIMINCSISEPQFYLEFPNTTVPPQEFREISIKLRPLEASDHENVPQSIQFAGDLNITTSLRNLSPILVKLDGTLLDEIGVVSIPSEIQFGYVYRGKSRNEILSFRNPVRRELGWKIQIAQIASDIFQIKGSDSGVMRARQPISIPISFNPKISASYSSQMYLETEEGKYTIQLVGIGVEPAVSISLQNLDFGIVGVNNAEYRSVSMQNLAKLPLSVRLRINSDSFYLDSDKIEFASEENKSFRIYFNPPTIGKKQLATLIVENADPELTNSSGQGQIIGRIDLQGSGGKYGLAAPDCALSGTSIEQDNLIIFIEYSKLVEETRVRKTFEVENCGETVICLAIFDSKGNSCLETKEFNGTKASYKVSPTTADIQPKTRQKFTITARGIRQGEETYDFMLKTVTLAVPKIIPIRIQTKVIGAGGGINDSLQIFAKKDQSVEALLDATAQNEIMLSSERNLWKVLLPVIRISPLKPSSEYAYIPCKEPTVDHADISPFVTRPPAIPRDLPPQTKKWYMNRVSMTLEQANKVKLQDSTNERRNAAAEFVSAVEKKVFLGKRTNRK